MLTTDRNREATNLDGIPRERSFSELAKGLASSTVCRRQGLWIFNSALLTKKGRYAYNAGAVTFAELFAPLLLMDKTERD